MDLLRCQVDSTPREALWKEGRACQAACSQGEAGSQGETRVSGCVCRRRASRRPSLGFLRNPPPLFSFVSGEKSIDAANCPGEQKHLSALSPAPPPPPLPGRCVGVYPVEAHPHTVASNMRRAPCRFALR